MSDWPSGKYRCVSNVEAGAGWRPGDRVAHRLDPDGEWRMYNETRREYTRSERSEHWPWNTDRLSRSEVEMVAYALRRAPMIGPDFTEDDRPAFDALAERFERAASRES